MKIRHLLIMSAALAQILFSQGAQAQTAETSGGITGRVVTRIGRSVIDGVKITLQGYDKTFYTNLDGRFTIPDLAPGQYTLNFQTEDFEPVTIVVRVSEGMKDINIVPMAPSVDIAGLSDDDLSEFDMESDVEIQQSNPTLASSKNVYDNIAGYKFSEMRFKNRGLDGENVYLNGILINDAMTGYSPWSLWTGLNDATRNQEHISGIGVSEYGVSGINGATNVNARASQMRKGFRASVVNSSSSYMFRVMASYASGLLDNGWSYAFSLSTRQGSNMWVDGVYYNAWGYFGSVEKRFGNYHSLSLTVFGTPTQRGAQNASVQEVYDLLGNNYYNSNWGYMDGKMRNARIRNNHEPVAMLNYNYTAPNGKISMTAAASFRFGKNGYSALDWYDAFDPRPDYYRNLPSYYSESSSSPNPQKEAWLREVWTNNMTQYTQINWDKLYNTNRNNKNLYEMYALPSGVQLGQTRSKYIIEERHTDQKDLNLKYQLNHSISASSKMTYGVSYRYNKTEYYKTVKDLLGGDYWLDVDQFAERDFADWDAMQNDLNNPNRAVYEGDKYGYDYYAHLHDARIWAVYNYSRSRFNLTGALEGGYNKFWREGMMRKGLFADNSFGDSEKQDFFTYKAKVGAAFNITSQHIITLNAAYLNQAPTFSNAFVSPRTRNTVTPGLSTEKTLSAELAYDMRTSFMKLRLSGYYIQLNDRSKVTSFYDDVNRTFTNFAMSGIDQRHIGLELGLQVPIAWGLSFNGALSLGNFVYTSNPSVVQTVDNSDQIILGGNGPEYVNWKNMYVESTPQTAANVGLSFRSSNNWYAGIDFNIYDRMYLSMNPLYRTDKALTGRTPSDGVLTDEYRQWMDEMRGQERFDVAYVLNANVSKLWYIQRKYQLGFSLEVKNILNNTDIRTGGYEQTRLRSNYDYGTLRYDRFPSKYFYMYGINYYLNIYFRF